MKSTEIQEIFKCLSTQKKINRPTKKLLEIESKFSKLDTLMFEAKRTAVNCIPKPKKKNQYVYKIIKHTVKIFHITVTRNAKELQQKLTL